MPKKDTAGEVLDLLETAVSAMGGQQRPGQQQMAREVAESIESGQHLLVQAGTGTGKSLAYLVPLIHHALESTKPALVSTATLALQAQIVGRDVPRLLAALKPKLPREVDVALLKGRSNYVCVHKTGGGFPDDDDPGALFTLGEEKAVSHPAPAAGPTSALGREVVRLRDWAEETETGDRDELLPGVSDRAWRQVSVTAMECLGAQRCPVAEHCFSEQARAKAAVADLVITNHAMLAISAFEGLAVLPDYDVVVIDEAHELQDRVTGAVTGQLSGTVISAAVTAARKHTSASVEELAAAGRAFDASVEGLPAGLMPSGLNEEQQLAVSRVREAARVALSDSKPEGGDAGDGGRQMARSRLLAVLELCERLLEAPESGEVSVVFAAQHVLTRGRLLSAGRFSSGHLERRSDLRGRTAAGRAFRRSHRGADLSHPGNRLRIRAGGRWPGTQRRRCPVLDGYRRRQSLRLSPAGRPVRGEGPAQAGPRHLPGAAGRTRSAAEGIGRCGAGPVLVAARRGGGRGRTA